MASDGRIFVAELAGKIKVFDGINDPTPTVFADLSTEVYSYQGHGLLGLALDPPAPTTGSTKSVQFSVLSFQLCISRR